MAIIKRGQRGDHVRRLQEDLNAAGFDCGAADGAFGPATHRAVVAFQRSRGLDADGLVGPNTSAALQEALRSAAGGTPGDGGAGAGGAGAGGTPGDDERPGAVPGGGSAVDTPVDWSTVPAERRHVYVMERLVGYGYPVNGAAGIVGNLDAESGVIPSRIEGSTAAAPLRARDFGGATRDFTPEEVMNRDRTAQRGPRLPGVGLAQWTSPGRRAGLFAHSFGGVTGSAILADMDAQLDYLVQELRSSYRRVESVLADRGVSVNDAADEVVYNFEVPGAILDGSAKRPRSDPAVQEVFAARRRRASAALDAYRRVHPD